MSGVRRVDWVWLVVALAGAAACRSHDQVCDETTCSAHAAGAAGAVGAEGQQPGDTAGAAGAAPQPECRRDADCANDSLCDGDERCESGQCENGSALECDHGMVCVESGPERCVYEAPSPWLLVTRLESVLGLPVAELGKNQDLLTLVARPREELLQGFDRVSWSADGKVALLRSLEREFGSRLELLRFGPGLPPSSVPLPNVPNWGDFHALPEISRDSTRALVIDGYSGLYLVDLTEAATSTRFITSDAPAELAFCADSSSWLQAEDETFTWTQVTVSDGELVTRALPVGSLTQSPDGRLVAMELEDEDEQTRAVQLLGCVDEGWSVDYPETTDASFSDDSQLLLLQLVGGGVKVMSLDDPEEPVEIWSDLEASASAEPYFVSGTQGVLVQYLKGEDHRLQLVDPLTGAAVPTPELPTAAEVAASGASSLLLWSSGFVGAQRDLLWHSRSPDVPTQVVLSDPDDDTSKIYACPPAPDAVLMTRRLVAEEEDTKLLFLRFDGELGELELVATFPGAISRLTWASDGSGVAISTQGAITKNELWWLPWSGERLGEPMLIAEGALSAEVQPWP